MPVVAEPRQRSGRATELRRQPLSGHLLESQASLDDRCEPAGGLEAEGRRHGVLQDCPGDHQRVAVIARERRGGRRHVVCFCEHERERPPGDEHRGRVDDVLARRAAVHVARGLVADRARQSAHQRLGEVADGATFVHELLEVEALRVAGVRDLGRDVLRHGAGGRPGVRERPLGVEHCLEPRPR